MTVVRYPIRIADNAYFLYSHHMPHSPTPFLFDTLERYLGVAHIRARELPTSITQNLAVELRPYQREALQYFISYMECDDLPEKVLPPHVLFNMATGSGKTHIMAAAMLYLYSKGYRNFLFFTRLSGVVQKTIANFTNPASPKYLFAPQVIIDGVPVAVRQVKNFAESDSTSINIQFQTINGLHGDLQRPKEGGATFAETAEHAVVLLGDEAHNFNAATKAEKETEQSWERTIERILHGHERNIFLAFTATIDWDNSALSLKYLPKTIYQYDLAHFRQDGFSKELFVAGLAMTPIERALGALVLSQYRKKVAAAHGLFLKPVVLMKSKTIAESESFYTAFTETLGALRGQDIERIVRHGGAVHHEALRYLRERGMTPSAIVQELRTDFAPERCVSVNSKQENEQQQLLVNTLEVHDNPVRCVFAVDKLNEGWDVLNLFDIVRLYDTRDAKAGKPGKTTMAEAQLIGRGARYWPFLFPEHLPEQRYTRKYDEALEHPLRILETLYYHAQYERRYIDEIKTALKHTGMIAYEEGDAKVYTVRIKESFLHTHTYKRGVVLRNKREKTGRLRVRCLADVPTLPDGLRFVVGRVGAGAGVEERVFAEEGAKAEVQEWRHVRVPVDAALWRGALAGIPGATFAHLRALFPHLSSVREFVESEQYLSGVTMTAQVQSDVATDDMVMSRDVALSCAQRVCSNILRAARECVAEYEGTPLAPVALQTVLSGKEIQRIHVHVQEGGDQERGVPMREARDAVLRLDLEKHAWYAHDENYGTSEEKHFLHFFSGEVARLRERYDEVHVLRNEQLVKVYDFAEGRAFAPDFLLFLRNETEEKTLQVFVEPKGTHLAKEDAWKQDFLATLTQQGAEVVCENHAYRAIGMPFYHKDAPEAFQRAWEDEVR
jgi:type III restriction enzyme